MITVWQSAVLGVVEGLTEFLPISSTGHLRITEALMHIPVADPSVIGFTAVIQIGAIAAVLVFFAGDIGRLGTAWVRGVVHPECRHDRDYRFAWWIAAATVPVVVAGLMFRSTIAGTLASTWVVGGALIAGSIPLWAAQRYGTGARGDDELTPVDVLLVGASQVLALLFAGFSRSGATISTGLLLNLDRVTATRLSFVLSIPTLTGAGIFELRDALGRDVDTVALGVGTAASFVVGYVSIAWLLKFVAGHTFAIFIVYRVIIGVALLGLLGAGVVTA